MSVDPAAQPPVEDPTAPPAAVVDPARPAATATDTPTPADSATAPDAPPAGGLGSYLDPAVADVAGAGAGEGGFVSAKPILMVGAAGPEVAELGHLLAEHGFPNPISEGKAAPPAILDDDLMRAVIEFQQANGINPWEAEPDSTNPPILRKNVHSGVVDARTWEALYQGEQPIVTREGARA